MKIRVVVATHNASGMPDFFGCTVECSEEEYNDGCHYDDAYELAEKAGHEAFVAFDENDGYAWLFENVFKDN